MRHRRDFRPGICLAFSLVLGTAVANAQIVYTCDSSIATTTCTYLNTTVAGFYSSTFSNANASIYIRMGSASLGLSAFVPTGVTYTKYVAALTANTNKSAVQTAALAALNANDATPYGSGSVAVTGALGAALGFTKLNGVMSDGSTICTLPATGCYNSVITITNDPNVTLYYDDKGGTEPDGAFDFYAVVQHETDEVLGTPSCVGTGSSSVEPAVAGQTRLVKTVILSPSGVSAAATSASAPTLTDFCGTGIPSAVDLYRYSAKGTLVLVSDLSTKEPQYFSYDGGATHGAVGADGAGKNYNTKANGADYADFLSNGANCAKDEAIQNAFGCPGQEAGLNILNDGKGEINILNAIGYNLVSAPAQPVTANKKLVNFGQAVFDPFFGGTQTKTDGLDLKNGGTTDVTIGTPSIVKTYGDTSQFVAASDCITLKPDKSCHVTLNYTPDALQISRATLTIPTTINGMAGSTISVPLTGEGISNVSQ